MHKYNFVICKSVAGEEDDDCSNNYILYNPYDHMDYFNIDSSCTGDSPVDLLYQNFI